MSCESRRPSPAEVPPPRPRPRPLRLAVPGPPATREVERTSARPGLVPRTPLCRIMQHCMHRRLELVPPVLPLRLLRRSANSWTAGRPALPSRGFSVGGDPRPRGALGSGPHPRARAPEPPAPSRALLPCRPHTASPLRGTSFLGAAGAEPPRRPAAVTPGRTPAALRLSPSARTPAWPCRAPRRPVRNRRDCTFLEPAGQRGGALPVSRTGGPPGATVACLSTDAALLTVSISPCSVCFYFWNTQISYILHRTSPKILYSTPLLLTSMPSPQNDTFSPMGISLTETHPAPYRAHCS